MAKIELLELNFNFDNAIQDIAQLKDTIESLKTQNKELKKSTGEITPEYEKTQAKIRELNKEYRIQAKVIDDYNKTGEKQIHIISETDGSIKSLESALARNRNAYRQLTKEQRETDKEAQKLNETIKQQDKEYKELQTEIGTTQVNVGNYAGAMREVISEQGAFGGILGGTLAPLRSFQTSVVAVRNTYIGTTKAVGGTNKSLRIFKALLVSTGIGVLLVALGSLVALLTKTQRGLDFIKVAGDAVSSVFANITDVAISLGQSIVNVFRNPLGSIKSLGKALKDNLINRFTAVLDLGGAIGDLFTKLVRGEFKDLKESAKEAKDALVQLGTGLDPEQQKKISDGIKDFTKNIGDEVKASAELRRELIALEKQEADLNVTRAKSRAEIQRLKADSRDQDLTTQQQSESLKKAIAIEQGILKQQEQIQSRRVEILKEQNTFAESTEEDLQRVRDAEIELATTQQNSVKLQTTLQTELNTINNKRLASSKKVATEEAKLAQEQLDEQADRIQAQLDAIDAIIERNLSRTEQQEEAYEKDLKALGAFGVAKEDLTEGQLKALEILNAEHQDKLQKIQEEGRALQLQKRLASNASSFALEQAELQTQLNERLLLVLGNEEETERLKTEFRQESLENTKELLDTELQEIQALLSQDLTADAGGGFADIIMSEEEKEALTLRLAEIQEKISEVNLQMGELGVDEDGERRTFASLIGLDEDSAENLTVGVNTSLQAVQGAINGIADIGANRTKRQLNEINSLRKKDAISQEQYDKRKEAIERQAFERQKKIQAVTATISYLQGVVNVLSAPSAIPDPFGAIFKGIQLGILTGTYVSNIRNIRSQTFEEGGLVSGKSHAEGGVPFTVPGSSTPREMEGQEYIVNKRATAKYRGVLDHINFGLAPRHGLGRPGMYQDGGFVPLPGSKGGILAPEPIDYNRLAETLSGSIAEVQIITDVNDVIDQTERVTEIQDRATI